VSAASSAAGRKSHQHVPDLSGLASLNFREELHAIEAAISGQGVAICSDVLVAPELANGALVKLTNVTMLGCTFYIVHRASHSQNDIDKSVRDVGLGSSGFST